MRPGTRNGTAARNVRPIHLDQPSVSSELPRRAWQTVLVAGLVAAWMTSPMSASPASADPFQLVGFTVNQPLGDQGVFHYSDLCEAAFPAPRVRMCNALEIIETAVVPTGLTGTAWVLPIPDMQQYVGVPTLSNGATCNGWTDTVMGGVPINGLIVDAAGHFTVAACNTGRSVACCAPTVLP